jgi:hypothetical protein
MESVGYTLLPRTKWWELSQNICDFSVFVRAVCRGDESDRSEARCHYDEPATMLRHSIIGTIDNPLLGIAGEMETSISENG